MKTGTWRMLFVILCLALLVGLGSTGLLVAQDDSITIGAILFSRDSFFQSIQTGMEAAAAEAGVELLVNIHEHDINEETRLIEDYVARGVDAILITPESLDASVPALRAAAEAGVVIVCYRGGVLRDRSGVVGVSDRGIPGGMGGGAGT
ncbi:MAG: substrate-binding domain-containing protein [Chloroflexi bacterium]|nr:substrate-binding domain-containing protein [Chloroflexota bacterium]